MKSGKRDVVQDAVRDENQFRSVDPAVNRSDEPFERLVARCGTVALRGEPRTARRR